MKVSLDQDLVYPLNFMQFHVHLIIIIIFEA